MSHARLLPTVFERTNPRRGSPTAAVAFSAVIMFAASALMALRHVTGSEMYDLYGSLSVFGFLTAYALVAAALPFAHSASGRPPHDVVAASILTIVVVVLITILDLRSSSDPAHGRIPYVYLGYITAGLALYLLRRRQTGLVTG